MILYASMTTKVWPRVRVSSRTLTGLILKMDGLTLAKGPLDEGKILIAVVDDILGSCSL